MRWKERLFFTFLYDFNDELICFKKSLDEPMCYGKIKPMSYYKRIHKTGSKVEKKTSSSNRSTTPSTSRPRYPQGIHNARDYIMHLQRTIGNQAVGQLIKSGWLQRKLNIGPVNDKYEQEADSVADKIVSMNDSQSSSVGTAGNSQNGEKQQISRTPLADSITPLQSSTQPEEKEAQGKLLQKRTTDGTPASSGIESSINAARGEGRSLSPIERSYYEPRFGTSFEGVKIHTDSKAAQLSRSVNARAFTAGQNVFFGAGQYSPNTVQQNNSRASVFRNCKPVYHNTNLSIQRQVKDARKNCSEWRFKKIPKAIAYKEQQEYRYLSHKNTYEPIPDKYTMTPVFKYVWDIHNYKSVRCNHFNMNGKEVNQLIGYYYISSFNGKLIAYKGSQSWEEAYTNEYNRLKKNPK